MIFVFLRTRCFCLSFVPLLLRYRFLARLLLVLLSQRLEACDPFLLLLLLFGRVSLCFLRQPRRAREQERHPILLHGRSVLRRRSSRCHREPGLQNEER